MTSINFLNKILESFSKQSYRVPYDQHRFLDMTCSSWVLIKVISWDLFHHSPVACWADPCNYSITNKQLNFYFHRERFGGSDGQRWLDDKILEALQILPRECIWTCKLIYLIQRCLNLNDRRFNQWHTSIALMASCQCSLRNSQA